MSVRSVMIPVLLLGLLAACDRQVSRNEQAAAAVAAAPKAGAIDRSHIDRSHRGEAAPSLGFEEPDGTRTTLAAFKGKPLLVNLWATWCGPCVKEMPTLDTVAADITVLPISQDLTRAPVTAFFAKQKFARLKPYLDSKTMFSTQYNASLPMSILFDATGHELWRSTGGMDWTSAPAKALLAEAR